MPMDESIWLASSFEGPGVVIGFKGLAKSKERAIRNISDFMKIPKRGRLLVGDGLKSNKVDFKVESWDTLKGLTQEIEHICTLTPYHSYYGQPHSF